MLVHNKGKYIRHAADLMLVPGANNVSENDYKEFSSHPIMKGVIESGEIVAHANTTKDLNADKAIDLAEDTFSIDLLNEFKQKEDRKTVLDAINTQLEELQGEDDASVGEE